MCKNRRVVCAKLLFTGLFGCLVRNNYESQQLNNHRELFYAENFFQL